MTHHKQDVDRIVVIGCDDCPLSGIDAGEDPMCYHPCTPGGKRPANKGMPAWCPLREATLIVEAKP